MELSGIPNTNEQTRFQEENSHIAEKYGNELPKPNPELNVVTIIPSIAELENDNFWRLLRSASTQSNLSTGCFEILYGVNNSLEEANEKSPRYIENQETLRIIEAIQQLQKDELNKEELHKRVAEIQLDITDHERSIVELAVQRNVHFYGVDISTSQKAIKSDVVNKIGFTRNILINLAYNRLKQAGRNLDKSLIDVLDADCFMPSNYYTEVDALSRRDSKWFTKMLDLVTPDIPKSIMKEPDAEKSFFKLLFYLKQRATRGLQYAYRSNRGKIGPSVVIKASAVPEVGGYPIPKNSRFNEDFAFQANLIKRFGNANSTNIRYYNSFRERDISTDGHHIASGDNFEYLVQQIGDNYNMSHFNNWLTSSVKKYNECLMQGYQNHKEEDEFSSHLSRNFKEYRMRKMFARQSLESLIDTLSTENNNDPNLTTRESDYLASNPAIIKMIKYISSDLLSNHVFLESIDFVPSHDKKDDTKRIVEKLLPEFFEVPKEDITNFFAHPQNSNDSLLPLAVVMHELYPEELNE